MVPESHASHACQHTPNVVFLRTSSPHDFKLIMSLLWLIQGAQVRQMRQAIDLIAVTITTLLCNHHLWPVSHPSVVYNYWWQGRQRFKRRPFQGCHKCSGIEKRILYHKEEKWVRDSVWIKNKFVLINLSHFNRNVLSKYKHAIFIYRDVYLRWSREARLRASRIDATGDISWGSSEIALDGSVR